MNNGKHIVPSNQEKTSLARTIKKKHKAKANETERHFNLS